MPETMSPSEKVARILFERGRGAHDAASWAEAGNEMQDWLLGHADAILTAIASGSGDHAELARLAAEANQPMPAKRRAGWWRRKARFEAAFTPSVCSALLAENAALRASAVRATEDLEKIGSLYTEAAYQRGEAESRVTEAERKLSDLREHRITADLLVSTLRTDLTEAERKLAEAVGLLRKIADHKPFGDGAEYRTDYQIGHDNAGSYAADLARSFLSKEAERG